MVSKSPLRLRFVLLWRRNKNEDGISVYFLMCCKTPEIWEMRRTTTPTSITTCQNNFFKAWRETLQWRWWWSKALKLWTIFCFFFRKLYEHTHTRYIRYIQSFLIHFKNFFFKINSRSWLFWEETSFFMNVHMFNDHSHVRHAMCN